MLLVLLVQKHLSKLLFRELRLLLLLLILLFWLLWLLSVLIICSWVTHLVRASIEEIEVTALFILLHICGDSGSQGNSLLLLFVILWHLCRDS